MKLENLARKYGWEVLKKGNDTFVFKDRLGLVFTEDENDITVWYVCKKKHFSQMLSPNCIDRKFTERIIKGE